MNIAIMATSGIYPLHIGGPANVGYFLAKEFGKEGHDVTVFTRVKNQEELQLIKKMPEFIELMNVNFVPIMIEYNLKSLLNVPLRMLNILGISYEFGKRKFDAILYNAPPVDVTLLIPLISKSKGINQFLIFHGYGGLVDGKNITGRFLIRMQKKLFSKCIVVSNSINNIPALFGIPSYNVETIYNGIDIGEFSIDESVIDLIGKPNILFSGVLTRRKGADVLLKAFSLFLKKYPQSMLYIVGDGIEKYKLVKLAQELNICEHINFTGFVDRKRLIDYYHSCDLYVMPSFKEAFGITLLESMCSRIPAIISDADGGPKEIVNNGAKCEIFKCGDSNSLFEQMLLFFNKTEQEIDEITEFNFRHVTNNYTWGTAAQKYVNVFKKYIDVGRVKYIK